MYDIKHNVKLVELANIKIDEYYTQKGIFENEIEFSGGCSNQLFLYTILWNVLSKPFEYFWKPPTTKVSLMALVEFLSGMFLEMLLPKKL